MKNLLLCKAVFITLLISGVCHADDEFRVTLLGTGDPIPRVDRFGPATLVEVGGEELLFDVGRGATQRLTQLQVPLSDIDAVFLTHLHSDHVSGIPDLWMTGWIPTSFGRRNVPFEVWGPIGSKNLMENLEEAYVANTKLRSRGKSTPSDGIDTLTHEFDEDGVVYESNGVEVTAFAVNHGDTIKPAYGYRIDYKGRSVVISGDTRYDENLINASAGADLIIHEVVLISEELLKAAPQYRRVSNYHTTPEEAGIVFDKVKPKLAVYTHLVMLSSITIPEAPLESLISRTRTNYAGPLVVGEDLMSFVVGDEVTIEEFAH